MVFVLSAFQLFSFGSIAFFFQFCFSCRLYTLGGIVRSEFLEFRTKTNVKDCGLKRDKFWPLKFSHPSLPRALKVLIFCIWSTFTPFKRHIRALYVVVKRDRQYKFEYFKSKITNIAQLVCEL